MIPKRSSFSIDLPRYEGARCQKPELQIDNTDYEVSFVETPEELDEVLRLRFEVFNVELNEGLERSYVHGRDQDRYDPYMDHLYIRDRRTREVVGTYRLQTAEIASEELGFYTDEEFKLSQSEPLIAERGVEIGRACVAQEHRTGTVLNLLWKGLAGYLEFHEKQFLFGCTSLKTDDPRVGEATRRTLRSRGYYSERFFVPVTSEYRYSLPDRINSSEDLSEIPRLLLVYIRHGAKVCSPPALDEEFQTIDFLTVFDRSDLSKGAERRFFDDE